MKSIYIEPFFPIKEKVIETITSFRPYRKKGIRLDKETHKDKVIFHNYGHGGGGISLAYGTAKNQVDLFLSQKQKTIQNQAVAVIGSGIVGLETALQLAKKGINVNLYAESFPFQESPEKTLPSSAGAGIWVALKLGGKADIHRYAKDSFKNFTQIEQLQVKSKAQLGVTRYPAYVINDQEGEYDYTHIEGTVEIKNVLVNFGGRDIKAKAYETFIIETGKYLPYLSRQIKASGKVNITQKTFTSIKDIENIKQKVVFNCMGYGSAAIFKDDSVNEAIKGHICKMDLKDYPQFNDCVVLIINGHQLNFRLPHSQSGRLVIGATFQKGNKNPFVQQKQIDRLIADSNRIHKDFLAPSPKL